MSLPLWQSGFLCSHRPVLQWPDKCQRFPGPILPAPWECACWSDPDCGLSWWYPRGTGRDDNNFKKHLIPFLTGFVKIIRMMFSYLCLSTTFKNSLSTEYFYHSNNEKTLIININKIKENRFCSLYNREMISRLYNEQNMFSFILLHLDIEDKLSFVLLGVFFFCFNNENMT